MRSTRRELLAYCRSLSLLPPSLVEGFVLQAKEKVIASLQEGGAGVSGSTHEATLEQLRLEKEAVRAELETARQQGEGLKAELQEVEEQHSQEVAQLTEQVRERHKHPHLLAEKGCDRFESWRGSWSQRRCSSAQLLRTSRDWCQN